MGDFDVDEALTQDEVDAVIDTHMKIYLAGDEAGRASDSKFIQIYPSWLDTKEFLRDMRKNVVYAEGNASHKAGDQRVFTLEFVTLIVEEVFEQYGVFQDSECRKMKRELLTYGDKDTGLVHLSSFYQAALDHGAQLYSEDKDYLRDVGALDESDPKNPHVIVPNYLTSKSNCIANSNLHSVCCI